MQVPGLKNFSLFDISIVCSLSAISFTIICLKGRVGGGGKYLSKSVWIALGLPRWR